MNQRQARHRVAWTAYGLLDARLKSSEILYPEDCSDADAARISKAAEDLITEIFGRCGDIPARYFGSIKRRSKTP